ASESASAARLERWQIDRCGTWVTWDVRFTPSERGATDISIAIEGDEAQAPAEPGARPETPRGKGSFVVTSASSSRPGTLAQAIAAATAAANDGGPDVIRFDIPGAGPHVISLDAPLPAITDAVVIDGSGDEGVSVELDGRHLDRGTHGLILRASSSAILGLGI